MSTQLPDLPPGYSVRGIPGDYSVVVSDHFVGELDDENGNSFAVEADAQEAAWNHWLENGDRAWTAYATKIATADPDSVNPQHYKLELQGTPIQVIHVIEVLGLDFSLGNALKYAWRYGAKGSEARETEAAKGLWYLDRWELREKLLPFSGAVGSYKLLLAGNLRNFFAHLAPAHPYLNPAPIMLELLGLLGIEVAVMDHAKAHP